MVDCTFYRIRWPGDGSIMIGRIDQPRRAEHKGLERFDLGGVFLRPAREMPAGRWWNQLGFRWIDYDRGRDGRRFDFAPGSTWVKMIGFPHGLLVIAWAGIVVWQSRSRST